MTRGKHRDFTIFFICCLSTPWDRVLVLVLYCCRACHDFSYDRLLGEVRSSYQVIKIWCYTYMTNTRLVVVVVVVEEEGGGGVLIVMRGRSRMTIDARVPAKCRDGYNVGFSPTRQTLFAPGLARRHDLLGESLYLFRTAVPFRGQTT